MLKSLRRVNWESGPAILTVFACYLAFGLWFSWYEKDLRRDYVGIGLYYGARLTVDNLMECSRRGFPADSFNLRIAKFTDSLRAEVNVDRLDLSF